MEHFTTVFSRIKSGEVLVNEMAADRNKTGLFLQAEGGFGGFPAELFIAPHTVPADQLDFSQRVIIIKISNKGARFVFGNW